MTRPSRKWLVVLGLASAWTAAWIVAWDRFLLASLYRQSAPGVVVFGRMDGDVRVLWTAAAVGLVLTITGVALFGLYGTFKGDSPVWSRVWLVVGGAVTLFGVALPVITPSTQSLFADEHQQIVALERRWLIVKSVEALRFDEITKLSLRIETRTIGRGDDLACKTGLGFSIVAHDNTVIDVPKEFADPDIAEAIAGTAGVLLEQRGRQEC